MSLLNVSWGYKWDPYKCPSPSSSGTDAMPCPAAPAGTVLVHTIQPCSEVASSHSQTLLKRLHPSFFHSKMRYFSHFAFIYPLHGSRKLLCFVSTHTRKAVHVLAGRGGRRWASNGHQHGGFIALQHKGATGASQEQEGRNHKAQWCRTSTCNSTSCKSTCIRKKKKTTS